MNEQKENLKAAYEKLILILKKYVDLKEEEYPVVATWIIAAHFQKEFPTFPYLFLNAMKRSGKTRLLNLAAFLLDGKKTTSLTESVLFRTHFPLFIDEVEDLSSKQHAALRETLNSAYKRGGVVLRSQKDTTTIKDTSKSSGRYGKGTQTKTNVFEDFGIKEFSVYRPIGLANINGLDDVLEDRCISIRIERSNNQRILNRLELFEYDKDIASFKELMRNETAIATGEDLSAAYGEASVSSGKPPSASHEVNSVSSASSVGLKDNLKARIDFELKICFDYLNNDGTIGTLHTLDTQDTLHTQDTLEATLKATLAFLKKINEEGISSRGFELWFPLLFIARQIDASILESLIKYAKENIEETRQSDACENKDTLFIIFLNNQLNSGGSSIIQKGEAGYISVSQIITAFRDGNPFDDWFTPDWVGKCISRNKLAKSKRRLSKGYEYAFDEDKLKEKAEFLANSNIEFIPPSFRKKAKVLVLKGYDNFDTGTEQTIEIGKHYDELISRGYIKPLEVLE